jgi:hypothetical protein
MTKLCASCGKRKDVSCFTKRTGMECYASYCKPCAVAKSVEWRDKNRERFDAYQDRNTAPRLTSRLPEFAFGYGGEGNNETVFRTPDQAVVPNGTARAFRRCLFDGIIRQVAPKQGVQK